MTLSGSRSLDPKWRVSGGGWGAPARRNRSTRRRKWRKVRGVCSPGMDHDDGDGDDDDDIFFALVRVGVPSHARLWSKGSEDGEEEEEEEETFRVISARSSDPSPRLHGGGSRLLRTPRPLWRGSARSRPLRRRWRDPRRVSLWPLMLVLVLVLALALVHMAEVRDPSGASGG